MKVANSAVEILLRVKRVVYAQLLCGSRTPVASTPARPFGKRRSNSSSIRSRSRREPAPGPRDSERRLLESSPRSSPGWPVRRQTFGRIARDAGVVRGKIRWRPSPATGVLYRPGRGIGGFGIDEDPFAAGIQVGNDLPAGWNAHKIIIPTRITTVLERSA